MSYGKVQKNSDFYLIPSSALVYTHKFLIATDMFMPFVSSHVIDIYLHISLTHVVSYFERKCKEHVILQFPRYRSLDTNNV